MDLLYAPVVPLPTISLEGDMILFRETVSNQNLLTLHYKEINESMMKVTISKND